MQVQCVVMWQCAVGSRLTGAPEVPRCPLRHHPRWRRVGRPLGRGGVGRAWGTPPGGESRRAAFRVAAVAAISRNTSASLAREEPGKKPRASWGAAYPPCRRCAPPCRAQRTGTRRTCRSVGCGERGLSCARAFSSGFSCTWGVEISTPLQRCASTASLPVEGFTRAYWHACPSGVVCRCPCHRVGMCAHHQAADVACDARVSSAAPPVCPHSVSSLRC